MKRRERESVKGRNILRILRVYLWRIFLRILYFVFHLPSDNVQGGIIHSE